MSGQGGQQAGEQNWQRNGEPPFQNKALRGAIRGEENLYKQNAPYIARLSGPNGPVQGLANSGNQVEQNTLQGQYLDPSSNPYLQKYANAAVQGLTQNYQNATAPNTEAAFLHAGSFGDSSAYNQAVSNNEYQLANAIGNTEANIYEPAYQAERQLQSQALNQLPGVQGANYTGPFAQQQYQQNYNQGLLGLTSPYGYSQGGSSYPDQGGFTAGQGVGTGLGLAGLANLWQQKTP